MDRTELAESTPEDEPLWDVLEEHLNEAEFCLGEFERGLDHPLFALDWLAAVEARLDAQLDGLVIGDVFAAERLLVAQLEDATEVDRDRVAVATSALLRGPRARAIGAGLFHAQASVRAATLRGCALEHSPRLEAWAIDRFRQTHEPARRAALMPIVGRVLEPEVLLGCVRSDDDALAAATAHVLSRGEARSFGPVLEKLTEHRDPSVRESALVACLAWGLPQAWNRLERLALDREADAPFATQLYAALGGRTAHARLAKLIENPARRATAVCALGYAGNPRHVPELLALLRSEDALDAKRAALAIALITGLNLQDDAYVVSPPPTETPPLGLLEEFPESPEDIAEAEATLPPLEADDLDASLVPPPEDAVSPPNPDAIARFWNDLGPTFHEQQRYHLGRLRPDPIDWLDLLAKAPLGSRHVLAVAFGIRTGGRGWLDTRLSCERQRQQLALLRALDLRAFERFYDR